ncbi:MAG TPA: flippase [Ktedonosporobacter sp.]|nr:flippase [Ktedonosporobacter sp.]
MNDTEEKGKQNHSDPSQHAPPALSSCAPASAGGSTARDALPDMQKTGRSIIFQLLFWGLAIPVIFPVTALLTRYLGPAQYGEYSFTLPFLAICALLSGTGMDPLIVRQLSRQPRTSWSETLSYAAGSRLMSTFLSVCAICLLALLLPLSLEQRQLLVLGCVSLFFSFSFNGFRSIYTHGFRAEQKVSLLILIETANRIVTALLVVLVVLWHLSLVWAYCLIIYSDLPFCIILMLVAYKRYGVRVRFSMAHLRKHLLGSLSLTGYDGLVLLAMQADILLLMWLTGPMSVGLYALAIRLTDPLLTVTYAYVNGVYPLLCTRFADGREQFALVYHEAVRIVALITIPLGIFVTIEAGPLVHLLGGQYFTAAAVVVQVLMWETVALFFSQLAVRACTAANMERSLPYVAAASVAVNIVANLALIPLWQALGAAIAALTSDVIGVILFTVLLRSHIKLFPTLGVVLQVVCGNLPTLAFLLWQQQASPLLTVPATLLLSIAGCVATRTLSLQDIATVRHILFSREATPVDVVDQSMPEKPLLQDISDSPTLILPGVLTQDITDMPTLILPRIHV